MGRKSIVAIVVLVILGVAGFFGWRFYTSPQYSLLQVRKAVEQRDSVRFEKYVDLEGIIRRTGNQLSSQWTAGLAKELGGMGGIEPEMVNSMMAAFGSAMLEPTVKQTREAALSFIETGRATPIQTIPGDAMDIASDLRIDSTPTIETQGKMATIDINLVTQGEPVRVRLFMRNVGSHWQIAEVDDAAKTAQNILAAYARGERKRIEAKRKANPDRVLRLPGQADRYKPLTLCYIPAGKFMMGSPPDEKDRQDEEGPRHRVHITRHFWMSKYEITYSQFEAFVEATGYVTAAEKDDLGVSWDYKEEKWAPVKGVSWRNPGFPWKAEGVIQDSPVVMVSWDDAVAFCKWVGEVTGEDIGLPTEAQWEYACRAGSTARYWWGDSDRSACQYANVHNQKNKGKWSLHADGFPCEDHYLGLAPVGAFQANAFGLHDMTGNVWEWCADWYGADYYASSPKEDPPGPAGGSLRVRRGGSWFDAPARCRSAYRNGNTPVSRDMNLGFRLAAFPAVR